MSLKEDFSQALNVIMKKDGLFSSGSSASTLREDTFENVPAQPDADIPEAVTSESYSSSVSIDFDPDLPDEESFRRARMEMNEEIHPIEERSRASAQEAAEDTSAQGEIVPEEQPVEPADASELPVMVDDTAVSKAIEEDITVITKNTVIDGNVRSFSSIIIDGTVNGDVSATKNIEVYGKVTGNITCSCINLCGCEVNGSISAKGTVYMDKNSILIGDVAAQYADVNGKIKGNLELSGKVEFHADAVVLGNINAHTISILDGANVQGYIHSTFLSDNTEMLFPEPDATPRISQ